MEHFIEVVQSVILPIVTMVLGYFGWRANTDRNKLKAELKGLEVSNISKEIENQSSWIDLYEKLANNQAKQMADMQAEIVQLKKTLAKHEIIFKKASGCNYYDVCPLRFELSKLQNNSRQKSPRKPRTNRQREHPDGEDNESSDDSAGDNNNNSKS